MVQDLEQCVVELELLFGSRKVDGQGLVNKIRDIQRELLNPAEAAASGGASPASGQAQVEKIQELLRLRLSELKVKRDHVRSMGKLDSAAVSQIAAEKLALELAMADQLMSGSGSSVAAGSRDSLRDAHWTVQKLSWLRRKLNGERTAPALEQSTTFGTYCAALAERLSAMAAVSSALRGANGGGSAVPDLLAGCASSLPAGVAQQLAEEEREMSELFAKYKEEKLQELARLLAHETLRMGDGHGEDNQLVEEVQVRQAWLEAQEVANKELVDSEVRQAMTRMAEVFAEDVATEERLAAALLLWPVQQVQYEHRCQVVEDVLRSEMEEAVLLLSNAYERSLLQMKADGLHQSAPAPEGDLEAVLSEFAEVVAHKALIDGHIAVLQGESPSTPLAVPSFFGSGQESVEQNVGIVQETESIIGDLSSCGSTSGEVFFPAVLNCAEVAAVLHRNLVEPRGPTRSDDTSSGASNEEAIRKKYQDEIEQLRALTEKGMSAMEGSHKRTIAQMEEKHQQELARLQVEKERALAEETQATLAALDAMRKAHEAEVQREIARFKEEFLSQMSSSRGRNGSGDVGGRNGRLGSTGASGGRDSHYAHRSPEREQEMEEIRREILSLNEKYSHKCLETAALEQKVSTMSQQLNMSQRQIGDLDARNQQLRAFLDAGQGPGTPGPSPQTPDGTTDQLRAKDSQLLMLQEDGKDPMLKILFWLFSNSLRNVFPYLGSGRAPVLPPGIPEPGGGAGLAGPELGPVPSDGSPTPPGRGGIPPAPAGGSPPPERASEPAEEQQCGRGRPDALGHLARLLDGPAGRFLDEPERRRERGRPNGEPLPVRPFQQGPDPFPLLPPTHGGFFIASSEAVGRRPAGGTTNVVHTPGQQQQRQPELTLTAHKVTVKLGRPAFSEISCFSRLDAGLRTVQLPIFDNPLLPNASSYTTRRISAPLVPLSSSSATSSSNQWVPRRHSTPSNPTGSSSRPPRILPLASQLPPHSNRQSSIDPKSYLKPTTASLLKKSSPRWTGNH